MKVLFSSLILTLLLGSTCFGVTLRLMTGDPQGTYYQVGQEIAAQTEKVGIHLEPLPSQGSWQNITALFNNDAEFAIFQVDAFSRAGKNLYRNSAVNIHDEIKVVMPLFHEEIHVLKAKARPLDFDQQKVFTVGCGEEDSGSCLSADVLAEFYGKQFTYVHSSYEKALDQLRDGTLDLVIITAGKPHALLSQQRGLDLVTLPHTKKAANLYLYTTITPQDYAWLEQPVETYAVRSVLATMIQEQEGLANNIVGSVHFSIQVNERELRRHGHPKWQDVLFQGFIKDVSHDAVLTSVGACTVIKSFGYDCRDLVTAR